MIYEGHEERSLRKEERGAMLNGASTFTGRKQLRQSNQIQDEKAKRPRTYPSSKGA
jgi:hypothetical protein